jgi:hypothetical protein
MKDGLHTIWIDNFNNQYATQAQRLTSGAWLECNWTGEAIRDVVDRAGPGLDDDALDIVDDNLPAITPDLFDVDIVDHVRHNFMRYQDHVRPDSTRWSAHFNVRHVPLCIKNVDDCVDVKHHGTDHHQALKESIDSDGRSLDHFHPVALLHHHIGSNIGLLRIVREWWEEQKKEATERYASRYKVVCCDSNIYFRLMKVHCLL